MKGKSSGWIEVICGPALCGKTTELIRLIRQAEIAKQIVQVFKHHFDKQHSVSNLGTNDGINYQAWPVESVALLRNTIRPQTTVVVIDAAHFFDLELTLLANQLADEGKRVIIAGLDQDFTGKEFETMAVLGAQAEKLTKLSAICVVCGGSASRTQRLIKGEPAPLSDRRIRLEGCTHEPRCRACHVVPEV